jgi:predicted amidohydrolase YtcJ
MTNLLAQFERFRILGQPMRCPQSCALALSAFLVGQIVQGAEPPADLVVLNGRVSREQALRMATIDAAYLSFDEKRKGSIEVGKLGDLVLLSDDLLTCDAERIKEIQPLATVVGGKVVHDALSR